MVEDRAALMNGMYLNTVEAAALEGTCRCCGRARPETLLWMHDHKGLKSVRVADINLLISRKKYTEVWTSNGFYGLADSSVKGLCEKYPNEWVLLHRNAAARLDRITQLSKVYMECGDTHWVATVLGVPEPVKISRRKWPSVKDLR